MAGIYTSPYSYPYPVNVGIPRQNGDRFGQYPWGRVYSLFLPVYQGIRSDIW